MSIVETPAVSAETVQKPAKPTTHMTVILNPSSDLGRAAKAIPQIEAAGASHHELTLVQTAYRGHASELAKAAADNGADLIVAAGGDGTVHEVINGLLASERADEVTLGVLPIGSGNDFAYALGLPKELDAAIARLFDGAPKRVDLAQVADDLGRVEWMQNNLGVGLDAKVVIHSEAVQRLHGFLKYFYAVLKTLAVDFDMLPLEMRFDGEAVSAETLLLAFGLGSRHGGGFLLTPDGVQDDGLIDTCHAGPMSRLQAIGLLRAAINGTHTKAAEVTMRQSKQVEVVSAEAMPIHIDGEVFATAEDGVHRVSVTVHPHALRVVC